MRPRRIPVTILRREHPPRPSHGPRVNVPPKDRKRIAGYKCPHCQCQSVHLTNDSRLWCSVGAAYVSVPYYASTPNLSDLTPRERDIVRRVAEGMSAKRIAAELGISENTVTNHITAIARTLPDFGEGYRPRKVLITQWYMQQHDDFQSPPAGATGHVYFFVAPDVNLVKVGVSTDPFFRFQNLLTTSPVPLQFLGSVEGDFELEARLHEKFKAERQHGEWFRLTPFVRSEIEKLIA